MDVNIPATCPVCGGDTQIAKENDTEVLLCVNPHCKSKLLGKLSAFASRNKMNIDGLSDETLSKFIARGWLTCFSDIYKLKDCLLYTSMSLLLLWDYWKKKFMKLKIC